MFHGEVKKRTFSPADPDSTAMFPLGFLLPKVTSFRPRDRERMVIKIPGVGRTWAATGLAGLPALRRPAGRSPLWCWNHGRDWILTVHEDSQGNSTAGSHRRAGRGKHGSPLVVNQMKPLAQACRIQARNNQEEQEKAGAGLAAAALGRAFRNNPAPPEFAIWPFVPKIQDHPKSLEQWPACSRAT